MSMNVSFQEPIGGAKPTKWRICIEIMLINAIIVAKLNILYTELYLSHL